MKFSFANKEEGKKNKGSGDAMSFHVAHITQVVENTVKIVNKETVSGNETFIWVLWKGKNGLRWLRYRWGEQGDMKKTLTGMSLEEMNMYITDSMILPEFEVWFSGNSCNIVENETIRDQILDMEKKAHAKERRFIGNVMKSFVDMFSSLPQFSLRSVGVNKIPVRSKVVMGGVDTGLHFHPDRNDLNKEIMRLVNIAKNGDYGHMFEVVEQRGEKKQ